jgi:hypothetical protein
MQIRTQVFCFVLFLAILLTASLVQSQVGSETQAQAVAPTAKANPAAFYAAVSQRFDVPSNQVRALVDGGVPATEVVVLYFVAQNSLRSADEILADREGGKSWREIAMAAGLGPELFYYPLPYASRKPFTNVYAVYHQLPRNRWTWEHLQLGDDDVVNLVNLRFLGELSGNKAPEVMRMRSQGVDYLTIHHYLLDGQQTASRAATAELATARS